MSEIENPIPATPDKCAAAAEKEHQKICQFGRRQLISAIEIGRLMSAAKEQLGHSKWKPAVKEWIEKKGVFRVFRVKTH